MYYNHSYMELWNYITWNSFFLQCVTWNTLTPDTFTLYNVHTCICIYTLHTYIYTVQCAYVHLQLHCTYVHLHGILSYMETIYSLEFYMLGDTLKKRYKTLEVL